MSGHSAALALSRSLRDASGVARHEDAAAQTRMSLALVRSEVGYPAEGLALARQSAQALAAMHQ